MECPELWNVMFAVDQTMSIESWNGGVKTLLRQLVDRFTTRPEFWTQIGLATYADQVDFQRSLGFSQITGSGTRAIIDAINRFIGPVGGQTANQEVLIDSLRNQFFRNGNKNYARNLAIIFTTGENSGRDLSAAVRRARNEGMEIIVAYLSGQELRLDNLRAMDRNGRPTDAVITSSNPSSISALVDRIMQRVCPRVQRSKYQLILLKDLVQNDQKYAQIQARR